MKKSPVIKGAVIGLLIGAIALAALYYIALQCLPYFVSQPDATWPWYCVPTTYAWLVYFAFPIPLLVNDFSQVVYYAPLTLLCYALIGALIGYLFGRKA